jgi:hypothetical protein
MTERYYDLKLASGKVARWTGTSGEDAARRYVDCMGGSVVAWRASDTGGISVLGRGRIIG